MVDPGAGVGAERVDVMVRGAAVHLHDQRPGSRAGRRRAQQSVHATPGPLDPNVLHRNGCGRRGAGGGQQHLVGAVQPEAADGGGLGCGRPAGPHVTVVAHGERGDRPGGRTDVGERAGREVDPDQPGARLVVDGDDHARGVRQPVGVRHLTFDREVDQLLGAGDRVPDEQGGGVGALVHHQQPLVAGDRRETERVQALARAVPQVGDRARVGQPQHAQRRVARVAVLAVGEDHEGLVTGQVADVRLLDVGVDLARRAVGGDGVHPDAVPVVAAADDRYAVAEGQAAGVRGLQPRRVDRGSWGRAERLPTPHAALVAAVVVEPPQPLAGRVDRGA